MKNEWFRKTAQQVVNYLETDIERGLAADIAATRLQQQGPNQLAEAEKQSTLRLFLEQFKNPLLVILLFGAAISFYSGHTVDAIAIAVIVLINALISFVQEHNAQKSMDSLKQMAAPEALVRRDGEWNTGDSIPIEISRDPLRFMKYL